ncbi:UTP5 [Candida pseudojiufengensis]|uniref:UTP5 n=1 Tax=Candida pseudojiufengensis TaxID=497109 RepID=UPI0022253685|nr:UTP5 [Candida pseudojiufengensis]KAI5961878.1 UTP5 [Candida pseudojiufengensis]
MSGPVLFSEFNSSNTYLASVIQSLDTHQIQVRSVNTSQSSLNTLFSLDKSNKVTNIRWFNTTESIHSIAICLTIGVILIYSPHSNEIIAELSTSSNVSVLDFHFSTHTSTGWSCDVEGNICEWDMVSYKLLQQLKIGDYVESVDSIYQISSCLYEQDPFLLLGANSIYLFNLKSKQIEKTFPGHIQPIDSIISLGDMFLTCAKGDRFINLYQLSKITAKAIFVTQASVLSISIGVKQENQSVLAAITENGNIEVFNDPLASHQPSTPNPKKKRRQVGTSSRSSNSILNVSRSKEEIKNPRDSNLMINAVSIQDENILFTWLENGTIPFFDTIRWIDSGNYLLDSNKTIIKNKADLKANKESSIYGHDIAASKLYNESHAIVQDGTNIKNLEADDSDEEEDTIAEKLEKLAMNKSTQSKRKLQDNRNGISLSVILTQALQNNDHSLLESVLQNRDPQTIQNTISRLNPFYSVLLLDKLSEKIQRQASRFNQLNYWLKWILVIHGSVIARLPDLNTKLFALHSVLSKKADTLPKLLELQGRLTLLYDQTNLKEDLIAKTLVDETEEDSDVEYIEDFDDAQFHGDIDVEMDEDEIPESEEDIDEAVESDEGSNDEDIPDIDDLQQRNDF